MILSFSAIDRHAQFRDFCCNLTGLETILDFLSTITSHGDTILNAYILDEGNRMELPPEAFDGQLFSQPLQQLEEQWQAALRKPVSDKLSANQWHIELIRQQIRLYGDRIETLTLQVDRLEMLRRRVEDMYYDQQRNQLMEQYTNTLTMYQSHIDRAQDGRQRAIKKLKKLESY
ncbi:hypothetical protein [Spirosoma sp. KNUC1025]|uniref:hypothetical protein n=1 Tax=Spirosoma sp. KNUC1025 TaxID=2894082 RepID=UPI0038678588|nr:hypothetical protein LN737_28135 [Spirosoma sp. KNUC1025]